MASQTQFLDFIFLRGQDSSTNPKVAEVGTLDLGINADLDQFGGLTIRPGFSPMVMDGLEAFDLYSFNENLLAFGETSGVNFPQDLFVFNNVVPAHPWRPIGGLTTFSVGSEVQPVGGLPYAGSAIFGLTVATNGTLVAASVSAEAPAGATRTFHCFNPDTDATILTNADDLTAAGGASWAVSLGLDFGWIRQNPVTGVVTLNVADVTGPGTPAFGGSTTLFSDSDPTLPIVVKTDATRIHVLYRVAASNNVMYRQFTHAGSQNGTGKVVFSASATTRFAMDVDSTQVHTMVKVNSTTLSLLTFGISSPFTTAVGPTSITPVGATMNSTDATGVELLSVGTELWLFYTSIPPVALHVNRRSKAAHANVDLVHFDGFTLKGGASAGANDVLVTTCYIGWGFDPLVGQGATALLRISLGTDPAKSSVVFYEDRVIFRADEGGGGNLGFNLAASGTALYVASGYNATVDGAMQANVRRVLIDSTARRPAADLSGLLYVSGGQIMVTEGQQFVESGLPPPFIEVVSQGTGGSLTQGGEYKYRAHYEWFDWNNNKHLSPVSDEITVQLTGSNDDVTFRYLVPPSLRAYPPAEASSSAPELKLFRTETNIETEPAVATGGPVSPTLSAGGTFGFDAIEAIGPGVGGGQLVVNIDGASTSINFSAGLLTLADVVDQLNTQLAGDAVVTVAPGGSSLVFTTVSEGSASSISFSGGSIIRAVLGLGGVTAQGTTETNAGEIFFLTARQAAKPATPTDIFSEYATLTDTTADADLIDNETLYTTGDRGAVSGVLDFAPPLPASYVAATRDRLVAASPNLVQISQKAFPNEAIAFVDPNLVGPVGFAYQARVDGKITGVAGIDDSIVVGTRDELFVIGGDGPNYVGIGEFSVPARIPSEVGFYDWRSIVLTSEGLWFLGDIDKLYLLPRGGGVPTWAGEAIQRRLGTFISGAAVTEGDTPRVAFAVGSAARAVVRDIKAQQWFEYALPATPARSWIEHRGKFYFVDGSGTVWEQTAFSDNGAVIPLTLTTTTIAPFGMNRQGRLRVVQLLAEFKTAATVQLEVSYDDGTTYVDMGTYTVSGLTADAPVRLEWFPHPQRGDRFKFRWTMTPTTATQGLVLNGFTLGIVPSRGETKLDAARRK